MSRAMPSHNKEQQQNWPFRVRLLIFCLGISLAGSFLLGLPLTRTATQTLSTEADQLRTTLIQQTSTLAADAIFTQDLVSLNVMLSQLVEHPHIAYAAVHSLQHDVIAEQGSTPAPGMDLPAPTSIQYQDQVIGLFEVVIDQSLLDSAISRIYGLWISLSLLFCALSALGGWWIGRRHGQALNEITEDVKHLDAYQRIIPVVPQGELTQLTEALRQYNQQKQAQINVNQALAKFMTPNVNDNFMTQHDRPELPEDYAHAAILFIDFVDFRQARKDMSPQELAALLNQYYFYIHQAARLYNGSVDKYVGDGVMVMFGIPQQDEKDCFHGVCTAMLLIGLLKQFNQQRQEQQLPVIEFQLGLHTGSVLAGTFGDRETLTYTAIGDSIHVAARLCHKGRAHELIITESVIEQGKLGSQIHTAEGPAVRSSRPDHYLKTFWVNELAPNYQALIERQVQHISAMQVDEMN